MSISGKVQVVVSLLGKGNAEAKIKGVDDALKKADKSSRVTAASLAKAGAAAAALGASAGAFLRFADEGRKSIRIGREFERVFEDSAAALERLRAATGHAIDDTSLERSASTIHKLGLSAVKTRELLELTSRAMLQTTGSIEGALEAAEQAAAGRFRALAKLGVIVNDQSAIREYAIAHGKAVAELTKEDRAAAALSQALAQLRDRYGDTKTAVDDMTSAVEKQRTAWDNTVSAMQEGAERGLGFLQQLGYEAAKAIDTFDERAAQFADAQAAAAGDLEAQTRVTARLVGEYSEAARDATAAQVEATRAWFAGAGALSRESDAALRAVAAQKRLTEAHRAAAEAARQQQAAVSALSDMYGAASVAGLANALTGAKRDESQAAAVATRTNRISTGRRRKTKDEILSDLVDADRAKARVEELLRNVAELDAAEAEVAARVDTEAAHASVMRLVAGAESAWDGLAAAAAQGADAYLEAARRIEEANERTRASIRGVGAVFGETSRDMAQIAPQLSGALGGISQGLESYADADSAAGKATAIIGGLGAVTKALVSNRKRQAAVEAVVQTAMGIASIASGNIPAAAAHFASAAAWGVVSGTASSASASSAASSRVAAPSPSPGRSSGGSATGGGTTNIYVQGAAIGTAQQVGAVVAEALGEAARSGARGRV